LVPKKGNTKRLKSMINSYRGQLLGSLDTVKRENRQGCALPLRALSVAASGIEFSTRATAKRLRMWRCVGTQWIIAIARVGQAWHWLGSAGQLRG
jgi:hypothetical protein